MVCLEDYDDDLAKELVEEVVLEVECRRKQEENTDGQN